MHLRGFQGAAKERRVKLKGTILNADSMPSLRRVFNHILQEESRMITEKQRDNRLEIEAAFHTTHPNKFKGCDDVGPKCEHCGKVGHGKAKCFELVGYPSNWNTRRSNRGGSKSSGGARLAWVEDNQNKNANIEENSKNHALHGSHMSKYSDQHDHMAGNVFVHGSTNWVLDSGTSHHMTHSYSILEEIHDLVEPLHIIVPAGDVVVVVKTMGTVNLSRDIKLLDVLYVPKFSCNLISFHKLTNDLNCMVTYTANDCVIQDQIMKRTIGCNDMHNGIYIFKGIEQGSSLAAQVNDVNVLWHARMGHPSNRTLSKLSNSLNFVFDANKLECCDTCHHPKQCMLPFSLSSSKANKPFELIHCDLQGKYHTKSHNRSHYFLTIVDDYTRAVWVYLLREKSESSTHLINFCNMIKTQFNGRVKIIRSDNGTEFVNSKL